MSEGNGMAYVMVYYTIRDSLALLTREEKGDLFEAILAYAEDGDEPRLSGAAGVAFNFMRHQIDRDKAAYIDRCEINRENGLKGGRPRKDGKPKNRSVISVRKSETEKTQYKDNEKDDDKENDKAKDHDIPKRDPAVAYAVDNLRAMSYGNLEELVSYKNDLPDDVIMHAVDIATANGSPTFAYVRAILMRYVNRGVKTMGDVKAEEDAHRKTGTASGKKNPALEYQTSQIDDSIFGDGFFVNLDGKEGERK